MKFPTLSTALAALSLAAFLASCQNMGYQELPEVVVLVEEPEEETVDFVTEVAPVLQEKCVICHYDHAQLTGLSFQRRKNLLAAGAGRPILVPGSPDKSTLFLVTVMPDYFVEAMPPAGHRLTDTEAARLYHWIEQGADWPESVILKPPPDA
jgi:hypothetical protein